METRAVGLKGTLSNLARGHFREAQLQESTMYLTYYLGNYGTINSSPQLGISS